MLNPYVPLCLHSCFFLLVEIRLPQSLTPSIVSLLCYLKHNFQQETEKTLGKDETKQNKHEKPKHLEQTIKKTLNQNKKKQKGSWNIHCLGNNSTFMQTLTKHIPVQVRFEDVFLLYPRWDMFPQR